MGRPGFDPRPGRCVCFLEQETFTPQKVLVIPRNRWLRLNMTEKLFTGTLNHNKNKTKNKNMTMQFCNCDICNPNPSDQLHIVDLATFMHKHLLGA